MLARACLIGILCFVLIMPGTARAGYGESEAWFKGLAPLDQAIIQTNLVLLGKYDGLIDGSFGQGTYKALLAFQSQHGGDASGVPSKAEIDELGKAASTIYGELGIAEVDDAGAGIAVYVPKNLLTVQSAARLGVFYRTPDGLFELQTVRMPASEQSFSDLYRSLSTNGPTRTVTYAAAGTNRFSVSGLLNGRFFYTRFYQDGQQSVGFSLSWSTKYRSLGSMVAIFLASFSYPLSQKPAPGHEAAQQRGIGDQQAEPTPGDIASGSGFFFGDQGMIATNFHVAGVCKSIMVAGYGPAKLIQGDKNLDLAAIQLDSHQGGPVASISTQPPALAQSVILLGYPLADLLNSSLNVSTGIVSSETGSGDPNWFTTNAGIEPGNSGGPILDDHGSVLGIAVAKLDDQKLLKVAGTTAPNVGFAIKDTTFLKFISIFNHREAPLPVGPAPSLQDTVRIAKSFTVQIICQQGTPQAAAVDDAGKSRPTPAVPQVSDLPSLGTTRLQQQAH